MSDNKTPQTTTLVLISKTGSGKSSLANALLGTQSFAVGDGMMSETQQCLSQSVAVNGRILTVVDTPGTMDVKDAKMPIGELPHALNACPNGIDAFLVVIKCNARFTAEEYKAIEDSVAVFGLESCKRAIVVFSHGDAVKNDVEAFEKRLVVYKKEIPGLRELLERFGNRYVLMDNRTDGGDVKVRKQQVETLMGLVDVVAKLNPKKYLKSDLDEQAEKKRREEQKKEKKKWEKKGRAEQRTEELEKQVRQMGIQLQLANNRGGGLTEVVSGVGQFAGAVIASPAVGAVALIKSVFG